MLYLCLYLHLDLYLYLCLYLYLHRYLYHNLNLYLYLYLSYFHLPPCAGWFVLTDDGKLYYYKARP